jgi:galactokinase
LNLEYPEILTRAFQNLYEDKVDSAVVSRAPSRIEILGNHTDYNGGLVLTSTIDQFIWIMGTSSPETTLHSVEYDETIRINQKDLVGIPERHWSDYIRGVYWAFNRRHHSALGLTGVIHGNLTQGGELGSSAALEVSLVNIISHVSRLKIQPKSKAMLAYEAERLFCGISCGVMDQFTAQLGKPNSLLGIHCGNMLTQNIAVPENISFIVVNSMVSRDAGDLLNERRRECLRALTILQEAEWDIHSLSAITPTDLQSIKEILDETLMMRVTHVVKENQRVRDGIAAMQKSNLQLFGEIMIESHNSSRDLYEVSHENLEILITIAQRQKGIFGSRLTGTGFGGNVLLLVKDQYKKSVVSEITKMYEQATGLEPQMAICAIPGGVVVEDVAI